jgi:hypothetical protein
MPTVRPYEPADATAWDALVEGAPAGTFLHTRAFLGYHGDRLADRSLVVEGERGLLGVLPAALRPGDEAVVETHPGATFGGLVRAPALAGEAVVSALADVAAHYRAAGLRMLVYKPVPLAFHATPDQDDVYALFRLGARLSRAELSAGVDVTAPVAYQERRRRALAKARRAGLTVTRGIERAADYWPVLEAGLAARHDAAPVHTAAEIADIRARCPGAVDVVVAVEDGATVAGAVVFDFGVALHTQYLMAGERGRDVGGLDLVIDAVVADARERGRRWVSFGTSNEDQGRVLNTGLYEYKRGFGAGGLVNLALALDL